MEGDGGADTDNKVSSINICTAFPWEHGTTAYLNIRGTKINEFGKHGYLVDTNVVDIHWNRKLSSISSDHLEHKRAYFVPFPLFFEA